MRDLGALVRRYVKWDDQPGSVAAAIEAILRAHRIALTLPHGPVYVSLDAALQEEPLAARVPLPALDRYPAPLSGVPPQEAVREAASLLESGRRPLLMLGRMSSDPKAFALRVALAERLSAVVLTDIKTGASFPTQHPLHPFPPSLYVGGEAARAIREADVILSLDWIDLGGTLSQACAGELPCGQVIHCSLDQYVHNGSNMDYQELPPSDLSILAPPDALVAALVAALGARAAAPIKSWFAKTAAATSAGAESRSASADCMPLEELARVTTETLARHRPSYIRLPLGWPGEYCRFTHPQDYIGFDGGGGIG